MKKYLLLFLLIYSGANAQIFLDTLSSRMAISSGKAVLSGHGTAAALISNNLHVGDTIKIYQGLKSGITKIKELIGGRPKLVSFGKNYLNDALREEPGSGPYTREPWTAAGFSADSTYLYLMMLDGISPYTSA
ncbi:MAG: hypothetical protein ACM3RX_09620 [Methanococcaceae archaeon]